MEEYTEKITNKIYARSDSSGVVIKLFSSVFEQTQDGDIMVEEGNQDHHAHVHLKYQLMDDRGRYNYHIRDGALELIPDEDKPPILLAVQLPTDNERIEALEAALLEVILGG